MTLKEKKEHIAKIESEQYSLLKKSIDICKKPRAKRPETSVRRVFKIFSNLMAAAKLQKEKLITSSN